MPIIVTSKKALEQVRRLHAMNVGIKGTTGEIVQNKRTKTMKTKSKVLKDMSDCPELKNQNYESQAGGIEARGMAHALEGGETNQDLNNMEDDINA
nr:hypothetical protein [Tanacetum cinerariifolium]